MSLLKAEYDEVSPITGNTCVLVEAMESGMNSYICMESGYVSNEYFKVDSEIVERHEQNLSQLMRDVKHIDESRGLVWYPAYMQFENMVLYCSGTSKTDLEWDVAFIVPVDETEKENYPVPGKPGEYFQYRIDVDNAERFITFSDAMDKLYANVSI
jgi:hypothetical protein